MTLVLGIFLGPPLQPDPHPFVQDRSRQVNLHPAKESGGETPFWQARKKVRSYILLEAVRVDNLPVEGGSFAEVSTSRRLVVVQLLKMKPACGPWLTENNPTLAKDGVKPGKTLED